MQFSCSWPNEIVENENAVTLHMSVMAIFCSEGNEIVENGNQIQAVILHIFGMAIFRQEQKQDLHRWKDLSVLIPIYSLSQSKCQLKETMCAIYP